jgi:hypothetical protein
MRTLRPPRTRSIFGTERESGLADADPYAIDTGSGAKLHQRHESFGAAEQGTAECVVRELVADAATPGPSV